MNLSNWIVFDKSGSQLNWYADSYLNLNFGGDSSASSASGYLITDTSNNPIGVKVVNSGFYYTPPTTVSLDNAFGETGLDITSDVSIIYKDVSIFNPTPINTQGIGNVDISTLDYQNISGLLDFNASTYIDFDTIATNDLFDQEMTLKFSLWLDNSFGYSNSVLFSPQGSGNGRFESFLLDSSLYICTYGGQDWVHFDITNYANRILDIEVKKYPASLSQYPEYVKVNDVSVSVVESAISLTTYEGFFIGHGADTFPGPQTFQDLDNATIWDVTIDSSLDVTLYSWDGYPSGNTNTAWVDSGSTYDGSIVGTATTRTIEEGNIYLDNLIYPSVVYTAAIFLEPVSKGIIETEHLFIFEQLDPSVIRPYETSNYQLKLKFDGDDNQIKFFTVNEETQTISWTDILYYDLNVYAEETPLSINIGFKAEEEGVYERKLKLYNTIDNIDYLVGEIIVNAEAIGEDERFRTLLGNFGLPDPKEFPTLFKEADINEALPDYEIINPKSKLMILDHKEITPYIGTYRALVNAIKWLGYEDIYIREWFKNVKEDKKLSLIIPYDAKDRATTILQFSPDQRRVLKKLNQLSLNYCITRETGEIDEWGTPITENCYTYSIDEVFTKLISLKTWLERYIIGVNSRIVDITGEGIYYERYLNLIYSTQNLTYDYQDSQTITPYTLPDKTELILGDASIDFTLREFEKTTIGDLPYKFSDFIDYVWNPADPSTTVTIKDASYLADPSSYLIVGPPISYPFPSIRDIQYRASLSDLYSGVVQENYVTNPLWVYDNEIRFYNIFDSSSIFFDTSVNVDLRINRAYIKDANNTKWEDSSMYSIYPEYTIDLYTDSSIYLMRDGSYAIISGSGNIYDASGYAMPYNITLDPSYIMLNDSSVFIIADSSSVIETQNITQWILESSLGNKWLFNEYVNLTTDSNSLLQYALDDNYGVNLLSMRNFKTLDSSGNTFNFESNKLYNLDIIDGAIILDTSIRYNINTGPDVSTSTTYYINYKNRKVTLGVDYWTPRVRFYSIDPSIYYWADPSTLVGTSSALLEDNSIYTLNVNHIGDYTINAYAWDGYNVMYTNTAKEKHNVWIKWPTLYALIDSSVNKGLVDEASTYLNESEVYELVLSNRYPVFDRYFERKGLKLTTDSNNEHVVQTPSTFFQSAIDASNFVRYYNTTSKITKISGTDVSIDVNYQSFSPGDSINLIKFYKGNYLGISEASSYITSGTTSTFSLDQIPSGFIPDVSNDILVVNTTRRLTKNPSNNTDTSTFTIDVSDFTFITNQLVNVITYDSCIGLEFGASYRVTNVDGSTHVFSGLFPTFIINDPDRYTNYVSYPYYSHANYVLDSSYSFESDSSIVVYSEDLRKYFLDSTFMSMFIPFNQEDIMNQWYDTPEEINSKFYYYENNVNIDTSTLVILKADYDSSMYMLNQKNYWSIKNSLNNKILFTVHNKDIPFMFDSSLAYKIDVRTYDYYGNLIKS